MQDFQCDGELQDIISKMVFNCTTTLGNIQKKEKSETACLCVDTPSLIIPPLPLVRSEMLPGQKSK